MSHIKNRFKIHLLPGKLKFHLQQFIIEPHLSDVNPKSFVPLIFFIIVGLAGNYLGFPIFLGIDFLFGSAAVLIALRLNGLIYGIIVSIISAGYTFILYSHSYTFIILLCETLVVGLLLQRSNKNMVLLDGIFWLFIGMPLVWIFYLSILNIDTRTTVLIMLIKSVNGIFNSFLAGVAIEYLPLRKWLKLPHREGTTSLYQTLFNILAGFVLFPALLITFIDSRLIRNKIEDDIKTKLEIASTEITAHVVSWQQRHIHAINELAKVASLSDMIPTDEIQQKTALVQKSFPDFRYVGIADAEGTTIALYPTDTNERSIGLVFTDDPRFLNKNVLRDPLMSDVFIGHGGGFIPVTTLSVPIFKEKDFLGFVHSSLKLSYIHEIFREGIENIIRGDLQSTLIDSKGHVIASTRADLVPTLNFEKQKGGELYEINDTLFQWLPVDKNMPDLVRWNKSFYVRRTAVGSNIPWTLLIEAPIAPYQSTLQDIYLDNLAIMLWLAVLVLILAEPLSRWLLVPLSRLTEVTTNLPVKLLDHQTIHWPDSSVTEIAFLVKNFKTMSKSLKDNFQEIKGSQETLERRVQERTQELLKINEDLQFEVQERKRTEDALRESEERRINVEKLSSMGNFAAIAAHEIRNPLNAIKASILFLKNRLSGDVKTESSMRIIIEEVERLNQFIKRILIFSRKPVINPVLVDVHQIIEGVLEAISHEHPLQHIHLEKRFDKSLSKIKMDYELMRQVLYNLIRNAIEAMNGGGRLSIYTSQIVVQATNPKTSGSGVLFLKIDISDTGHGIAPEHRKRIFEPFFTTKPRGVGVGLAFSYFILESHKGTIDVESEPGKGTTFSVRIPI